MFHVVHALRPPSALARGLDRREEQGHEDAAADHGDAENGHDHNDDDGQGAGPGPRQWRRRRGKARRGGRRDRDRLSARAAGSGAAGEFVGDGKLFSAMRTSEEDGHGRTPLGKAKNCRVGRAKRVPP